MALFCAAILYLIAAILGFWSASLLWRAWWSWRLQRRGKPGADVLVRRRLSGARRGFGVGVALLVLPVAGAAFALGGFIRRASIDPFNYQTLAFQALAAALGLLALGGFHVAWRFDPSMGRRRCSRCWYDMSATPGLRCPECGAAGSSEKAMFRTRRAPRVALLSIAFLAAGHVLYLVPEARRRGWAVAAPTTALIVGLPWWPHKFIAGQDASLHARVQRLELWEWQKRLLERRCRGMIEGSTDIRTIGRAGMLIFPTLSEGSPTPTMGVDAQLAFFAALQAEIASGQGYASLEVACAVHFVPAQLGPEARAAALPALHNAFASPTPIYSSFAITIAPSLGRDGTSLVPPLFLIANATPTPWVHPHQAVMSLARLGETNDAAWDAFLKTFESAIDATRASAAASAGRSGRRDEAVRKRLIDALNDPADSVSAAAAASLAALSGGECAAMTLLAPIIRSRPWVLGDTLEKLALACPDADVIEGVRILLRARTEQDVRLALNAVTHLHAKAAPLLPELRRLKEAQPFGGLLDPGIAQAIENIEAAAGGEGDPSNSTP